MDERVSHVRRLRCRNLHCERRRAEQGSDPTLKAFARKGFYSRKSDGKRVTRFICLLCRKTYSTASLSPCYWQKKRRVNVAVVRLLVSGVSQRRVARLLVLNRKTVIRKFLFMASQARLRQGEMLKEFAGGKLFRLQFDEMESAEHSKCLPLSIPLLVEEKTRRIVGFKVCRMPAKGLLAGISRKKYGKRSDERQRAAHSLFASLSPYISANANILSDENPKYSSWIKKAFPHVVHRTTKGRRGAITGQGELKKIGFDPLFSLNHTCAMLRANINRLFRRTWCTTKRADRLEAHIMLYADYHNRVLIKAA